MGGVKMHHGMKKLMSWVTGEEKRTEENFKGLSFGLNAGDRVDWALQEDMTMLGSTGELLQALPSHACYFTSADVGAFIQKQSAALAVDTGDNSAASGSTLETNQEAS